MRNNYRVLYWNGKRTIPLSKWEAEQLAAVFGGDVKRIHPIWPVALWRWLTRETKGED
jgi:hypothetical protein